MTKFLFSSILIAGLFAVAACHKHDDNVDYDYHAHIHSPNTDAKHVGDTLQIEVEFESHTGETVHNVEIKIYNKADGTVVYTKPDEAHVHETSGLYEFNDTFILSNANGIDAHTDWVLQARVCGHEGTEGEVIETVEFHVHP